MKSSFRIEPLSAAHDRAGFGCGEEALDRYFQTQATQDIRRRVANCFVAVEVGTGMVDAKQVAAFYTMSAASIPFVDLPPEETKRLPRYPTLPAVRIGRLAVDERFQGRGLGAALLANAAKRAIQAAAAFALLVDAKNDQAVAFYQRYGFRALISQPRTLFLPLATAQKAFLGKADH
jgi:ribosomal protein S18 acetylase RimI-like enzyme